MKKRQKPIMMIALVLITSMWASAQSLQVPLRFDHYYTYEEVNEAMLKLHEAYPDLTHTEVLGQSDEGRDIRMIRINNPQTGAHQEKPALYIDGNIHGNEIQATEVCLYFLDYVLKNYGSNEKVTQLLDRITVYAVPSVNVDGRWHFFADGNTSSSNRGLRIPKDDDGDGLVDEDPVDDLNGDGHITSMRKKVPYGEYRLDPDDPRIMIRVDEGETGDYTLLGSEGIDNDGDGRINEDDAGYVDGNRNWGVRWQPNYVQRGGGSYPFEGSGMKALSSFLHAHPNILMVWAFHNSGGMFLRGPNQKGAKEFDRRDVAVLDYLGQHAEKMVPGYRYLVSWKDLYTTWGDFGDFTESVVGAFTFVGELHQSSLESYRADTTRQARPDQRDQERMDFNDYLALGEMYVNWETYDHPVFGVIEIGGWTKFTGRLPQPFMIMDMVHRNAMAVFETAWQLPDIRMEVFEKEEVEKDLWRIRVRLINDRAVSSITWHSVQNRIHPQDQLRLSGDQIRVLAGGPIQDVYTNRVNYKEHKPELQFLHIPGFGREEYQFLVRGKGKVTLSYSSVKARNVDLHMEL